MTDMPEFRAWADAAHRDSMRVGKRNRNPRYRCTACNHRTTKNFAKAHDWNCHQCRAPLRVKANLVEQRQKLPEVV